MIGVQKQQNQKNVLNRSQRRTPLNVVVEKIGTTRAVVHGDLSKESLKELLMSEISVISKAKTSETKVTKTISEKETLTEGFSETTVKDFINVGDKENNSKDTKKIDSGKDEMKMDQKELEKDKGINKGVRKDQGDAKKDVLKKSQKQKDQETETTKKENQDKETEITKKDKETDTSKSEVGENERKEYQDKEEDIEKNKEVANENEEQYKEKGKETAEEIFKKGDKQYQNKEMDKQDQEADATKKEEFEEKDRKKYHDEKIITSQKAKYSLQEKRKNPAEADILMQTLFRRTELKTKGKKTRSEKQEKEMKKQFIKRKDSRHDDKDPDTIRQIEEISEDEFLIDEAYKKQKKEERSLSKMSDDKAEESDKAEEILDLSYDGKWLRKYLKKPLILAMNEIIEKKPKDPVNYLGFWFLNYRNCQENCQREKNFEKELLEKRKEWKMLHDQTKETPELTLEQEENKHQEEEESAEDWNFTNYGVR